LEDHLYGAKIAGHFPRVDGALRAAQSSADRKSAARSL